MQTNLCCPFDDDDGYNAIDGLPHAEHDIPCLTTVVVVLLASAVPLQFAVGSDELDKNFVGICCLSARNEEARLDSVVAGVAVAVWLVDSPGITGHTTQAFWFDIVCSTTFPSAF